MAAYATEIVSTEQMRRELFLPGPEAEPDAGIETDLRLTGHIEAAVDWVSQTLEMNLLDIKYWRVFPPWVLPYDAFRIPRSRFVSSVAQVGYWMRGDPHSRVPPRIIDGWEFDSSPRTGSAMLYPPPEGWPLGGVLRMAAEISEGWRAGHPSAQTAARVVILVAKDMYLDRKGEWGPLHAVTTLLGQLRDVEVVA